MGDYLGTKLYITACQR